MVQVTEAAGGLGFGERIFEAPPSAVPSPQTWWDRYAANLGNLSRTTREVLEVDSEYIVEAGVFGEGSPSSKTWPAERVRRGLVMGSVQSGKTASMLGVAAKALDRGVDVVVILAGTRLSLWRQTYGRLRAQLDSGPETVAKGRRRIIMPEWGPLAEANSSVPLATLYRFQPAQIRRGLTEGQPLVVVAMKQTDHLRTLGNGLRLNVFPTVRALDRPVHMLVLDDEADDGSVLDARIEASEDPVFGRLKQIPRAIADLWSPRAAEAPVNLFATYVGYTATPQANFLQEDQNPLFPREFVVSLRTPFDAGAIEPRTSTYHEPAGLESYYTGGAAFYERGRAAGLCSPVGDDPTEDLADALRAFLVAGAISSLRSPERLGPLSATVSEFESKERAVQFSPEPHSMLIHPSASVQDHFDGAVKVLRWAGVESDDEARALIESGNAYLPASLSDKVDAEESKWSAWVERYRLSALKLQEAFSRPAPASVPTWSELKDHLQSEVIPGTRVAVVNSNPLADDRPEYEPKLEGATWRAARDLSTIFVSGNVMARGLTLEGLTTTFFLRDSEQPLADSQMQMQRWFGYRGKYLELCRLFATPGQLKFFASYHDVDEAMRQVITAGMRPFAPAPSPGVLQGSGFLATGKIANLGNHPLCQGSKTLIRLVNPGDEEDPNTVVVSRAFSEHSSHDVLGGGVLRGRVLDEPMSLLEAADLLDQLQYSAYVPGPSTWLAELWREVQARVEEQGPLPYSGGLYRPPSPSGERDPDPVRKDCPYGHGAYLRLWDASLSRRVRGLIPTDNPSLPWRSVDLAARRRQKPRFWIGIRYGGEKPVTEGQISELSFKVPATNRRVEGGLLKGPWGSQDPSAGPQGYRGDEYLDYYSRGESVLVTQLEGSTWRPVGADGLILFYVNQPPGQAHPTVITGVSIPIGGPDQFAASTSPSKSLHEAIAEDQA